MVNPTHFDLHSLRVFLTVAETGSLTRAAERSHMTLSAISKRIADPATPIIMFKNVKQRLPNAIHHRSRRDAKRRRRAVRCPRPHDEC